MKLDTHVHTQFSGYSSIKPLSRITGESYNAVETAYRLEKARGMDFLLEDSFNRELLVDLVANHRPRVPEVA